LPDFILAIAASQSVFVSCKKPLPLQLFCPWQALVAVLQAEVPLQELTPSHLTLAASAALTVATGAAAKKAAAAVAKARPDNF
jgi:hypothetical protein